MYASRVSLYTCMLDWRTKCDCNEMTCRSRLVPQASALSAQRSAGPQTFSIFLYLEGRDSAPRSPPQPLTTMYPFTPIRAILRCPRRHGCTMSFGPRMAAGVGCPAGVLQLRLHHNHTSHHAISGSDLLPVADRVRIIHLYRSSTLLTYRPSDCLSAT